MSSILPGSTSFLPEIKELRDPPSRLDWSTLFLPGFSPKDAGAASKNAGLLSAINSGKAPEFGGSLSSTIASINSNSNHNVRIHVNGNGKGNSELAAEIAAHVRGAITAPPDRFRYSAQQKLVMAQGAMNKAYRKNG